MSDDNLIRSEELFNATSLPVRQEIVHLFMLGESVNHIAFLLDYEYDSGVINAVLRETLRAALLGEFLKRPLRFTLPKEGKSHVDAP